jgi:hypothetical protein
MVYKRLVQSTMAASHPRNCFYQIGLVREKDEVKARKGQWNRRAQFFSWLQNISVLKEMFPVYFRKCI